MHLLTFRPHDTLFFRDGRPMDTAAGGQGAHFPDPHVLNSALHAACHRAFAQDEAIGHRHGYKNRHNQRQEERAERFGSLRSIGPFPLDTEGQRWFPRPLDCRPGLTEHPWETLPADVLRFPGTSSLPTSLRPVVPLHPPSKAMLPTWMNRKGWEAYLKGQPVAFADCRQHGDFFAAEHRVGIARDYARGSVREGGIYSKAELRLHEGHQLAAYVESGNQHASESDLIEQLFPANGCIQLGGEGRTCAVRRTVVSTLELLPQSSRLTGPLLKWVLLSPAIFPAIQPTERHPHLLPHPGGWLPTWVEPTSYDVKLLDGPGKNKAKRLGQAPGKPIQARLIAAHLTGMQPITGWANAGSPDTQEDRGYGARSTLLAVPAGSVYYFKAADTEQANKLAAALNWHGTATNCTLVNRRSTLLGEKGFGIGVCAPALTHSTFINR